MMQRVFAVREELRADVAVYQQGISNAEQALNMLATAESAMALSMRKLVRMKELAEQAATGTYTMPSVSSSSPVCRQASEIDRIASSTEFAGRSLLNGNLSRTLGGQPWAEWLQTGSGTFDPATDLDEEGEYVSNFGVKIHFGIGNNRLEDYYFINIADMTTNGLFREVGDPAANAASKVSDSTQHAAR
jgi:flagellin